MAKGDDQTTSTGTGTAASPPPFDAKGLGNTLGSQLQAEANKPAQAFDKPLYAGLSDGTKNSMWQLNESLGQYQPGLNDAFNTVTGMAKNGVDTGAGAFDSILSNWQSLYGQTNKPTSAETNLTGLIPGLKAPSFADSQAKALYQATLDPSFAQAGYRSMYDSLGGPSITERNLASYADGSQINANPWLDKALETTRGNTMSAVNSSFGASGRLGSGLNIDTASSAISGQENAARLGQYNQDVQTQFNANSAIEAARAGLIGQRSGLLAGEDAATTNQLGRSLSALGAQDGFRLAQAGELRNTIGQIDSSVDNRATTLGGLLSGQTGTASARSGAMTNAASLQLQAANGAGQAYQNAIAPSMTSIGVGQAFDADRQAQLLAENDLFQRQQNAQLDKTGNILGLLNAGAETPGIAAETPWWQTALGYVAGNAGKAISMM